MMTSCGRIVTRIVTVCHRERREMLRNCTLDLEFMLLRWCPGQGSNLHDGITRRGILSPLCLPVSPPGLQAGDCVRKKLEADALYRPLEAGDGIEPASTALQAAA